MRLNGGRRWASIPWLEALPYLGFALIVFGAKLALITHFANATPFWDQWDAEADRLYRPWLEGTLSLSDLFSAHNEHRIVLTRLLGLALLESNGRVWDPVLQMQMNAGLHVLALCILLYFIGNSLPRTSHRVLFVFCAVMFSVPFAWENTLAGFQSQFYFLLLFSFIYLWAMSCYEPYTLMWWLGFTCGMASVLALASGALTLLVGVLLLVLRSFYGDERRKLPVMAIVILLSVAITTITLTPSLPAHAPLKAQSLAQFIKALTKTAGWPVREIGWLVVQVPLLIFMYRLLRGALARSARNWFIFALGLWLFGQFVSLAYGRTEATLSSRYQDILAVGLVLNFACILAFLGNAPAQSQKRYGYGAAVWLVFVALGFSSYAGKIDDALQAKAQQGLEQEKNVRAYLASRDFAHLVDKPFLTVPYPDAARLKSLLDNPTIEGILPGNIAESNSRLRPSLIKRAMNYTSRFQVLLIFIGVASLLLSLLLPVGAERNAMRGHVKA